MMKMGRTFAAYRYFLIPSEQISLFDTVKEKRREVLDDFFKRAVSEKKISYEIEERRHVLAFERKVEKNVLVFKFGTEKYQTNYHESDTGIEGVIEPNLPFVYLIFDINRQLLLIEMNTSVFRRISQAQKKFISFLKLHFFSKDLK